MSGSERVVDTFPVDALRARFPAIRESRGREVFFDNAAGAQVPDEVIDAMREHLVQRSVNRGGRYGRSWEVDDATSARARSRRASSTPPLPRRSSSGSTRPRSCA